MTVLAAAIVAVVLAPHAIAAWRSIEGARLGARRTRTIHAQGVRAGRWQTIALVVMVALLIGTAR